MFKFVALLILLPRLPNETTSLHTCKPNTQFVLNGRLCFCNNRGYVIEANCKTISRRQACQPGQTIRQGCNQCICQENGYLLCSNSRCSDTVPQPPILRQGLTIFGIRCTPYRSYYINCSVCVCPASGNTNDAQCVRDISCNPQNNLLEFTSTNKVYCIPNVMYLMPCKQCLCPNRGYFEPGSCIEKCKEIKNSESSIISCNPGTFYRIECNICRCPNNSIADNSICVSAICNNMSINALRTDSTRCVAHTFTAPRCMYCDCDSKGAVNENSCWEIDCAKKNQLGKHKTDKSTCQPKEMVPICIECFCTRNSQTIEKYCSRLCSHQNRLNIMEAVLKDAPDFDLIDKIQIARVQLNAQCAPNSLYLHNNRYCLCPENGTPDVKFCTTVTENLQPLENQNIINNKVDIDYNSPCEPNTLVEFDCNTCYCAKNGKIDPNWCTYDDCHAKRVILEAHKTRNLTVETESGSCQPGAISKLKCNFCICPESGVLKEKACTQNDCTEFDQSEYNDKLTCEPLAYYEVDCNICYCPRDGIKNVAKCTKNQCEKSLLRSDSCVPGQLFTVGCNLCVCPPDGNKMGKACTNHVCPEVVPGKILELPDDLEDDHDNMINYTKSLDQCFPGEQFTDGCNLCICTELGLKMYAICETVLCDDKIQNAKHEGAQRNAIDNVEIASSLRSRRNAHNCYIYNVSSSAERKECTPGTSYIIRCKECICPYFGNINNFCRPMARNKYCEQAFPGFNYLPMGRRKVKGLRSKGEITYKHKLIASNITSASNTELNESFQIKVKHDKHTEFKCERPGTILDKCFICNCEEDNIVIEEHCYKSDDESCADAKPSFLLKDKVSVGFNGFLVENEHTELLD